MKYFERKSFRICFSKPTQLILKHKVEAIYNLGLQQEKNQTGTSTYTSMEPFTGTTGKPSQNILTHTVQGHSDSSLT